MILRHRRGELSFAARPLVMGILNVTPDSFSDGGRFSTSDAAVDAALALVDQGADVIDVGGESTRPGAAIVPEEEEIARTEPVIRAIRTRSEVPISIDTTKSSVARAAIAAGADIVNDISAMRFDPRIAQVVAETGAGLILMHTPGRPTEMDALATYDDIVEEVRAHLEERVRAALDAGIAEASLALDPGYGFGKTPEQNYRLLAEVGRVVDLGFPVLVGVSRKRHIRAAVGAEPLGVEHGTTAANTVALAAGAHMIRVHDVVAGAACARMVASISPRKAESGSRRLLR